MNPATAALSQRDAILDIAARHGVGEVLVFGSAARGDSREGSDLDLLVEVTGPTSPWFPGGLIADLEALLGCRVDIAERRSLDPRLLDMILRDARPL
jgi:predicted nucleotidyltransferase